MTVILNNPRVQAQKSPTTARPHSLRSLWKRLAIVVMVTVGFLTAAFWFVGYATFYRDNQDPLQHVDAIVVLGGDDDGREDYGRRLALEGYADTLVVSNPYPYHRGSDPVRRANMRNLCNSSTPELRVVCFEPEPATTKGEAMFVEKIANDRGWTSVMVITWRYHLVRAEYIFGQCFRGHVATRSVPRSYDKSIGEWFGTFAYQYGGFIKAAAIGCRD
ncbi:YdcF family protein [Gordonia sp. ABKF26]|nr:YdcF family protein [Gordonia terrae]UPW10383.1 YdcF family protein [Gordonia terrae]